MKAYCDSSLRSFCRHGLWIASLLMMCQCSLPPRQAWQNIRANGLFSHWNAPSPPFGASSGHSQRYAAHGSYSTPRYSQRMTSVWRSGQTARVPYRPAPQLQSSRYYAAPTYPQSRVVVPRPEARPEPRYRPEPSTPPPSVARMRKEEPRQKAPRVARNEPPAPPEPSSPPPKLSTTPPPAPPASTADLPFGSPVPGRPNMVNSPYAGKTQLVDVSGMGMGQTVKCPYSGKLFKVPGAQQATNNAEPRVESKVETPKMSSEPKAEDKKP